MVKHEKTPWKGFLNSTLVLSETANEFGCRYAVCARGWQNFHKERVCAELQTQLGSGAGRLRLKYKDFEKHLHKDTESSSPSVIAGSE